MTKSRFACANPTAYPPPRNRMTNEEHAVRNKMNLCFRRYFIHVLFAISLFTPASSVGAAPLPSIGERLFSWHGACVLHRPAEAERTKQARGSLQYSHRIRIDSPSCLRNPESPAFAVLSNIRKATKRRRMGPGEPTLHSGPTSTNRYHRERAKELE